MRGWFDAFRDDGGPTLYTFANRTPVTGDVSIVAVSVLFATLYLAFLVIFPGVRKQVSGSGINYLKGFNDNVNTCSISEILHIHHSHAELICGSSHFR